MNLHDRDNFRRGKKEGIIEGLQQGAHEKAIETAKNFLDMGLPIDKIAQGTGLPLQTVEELAKSLTPQN